MSVRSTRFYSTASFQKVIVPVVFGHNSDVAETFGITVAPGKNVLFVGIVLVGKEESLSGAAALARRLRTQLRLQAEKYAVQVHPQVLVSSTPWVDLLNVLIEEKANLLILDWNRHLEGLNVTASQALESTPCNLALVRGPLPACPKNILASLRGGPYAELVLRLSLAAAKSCQGKLTVLHLSPQKPVPSSDLPYRGLQRVLDRLPEISRLDLAGDDPGKIITEAARNFDLLVLGASARPESDAAPLGAMVGAILKESTVGMVVVKPAQPLNINFDSEASGKAAISVLVDKWFAENTYHANEFTNLERLLELKRRQNVKISLALPALNEQETVGRVISTVKTPLMDMVPLLDEIVLIDSNSTDATRSIAASMDIPVYIHQELLPGYGSRRGKGEALWKSLLVTQGDIILWIDTDIVNIHPRFVYGLIGPLLNSPKVAFVKGYYRRPIKVGDTLQAGGGGRVTELTARPLINLFYPELSGVVQPLSGEYGGRRSVLEQLPFYSGYGVEIGLLIDIFERCGLHSISQVDLQERVHHNQPLEALSKMSFAIIQAVTHKLEHRFERNFLEEVNKTMKLIRYETGRFYLEVEEIAELERPPMIQLPEYQVSHPRS